MTILFWALWGLAGAFAYAAPRLPPALDGREKSRWRPWTEALISLCMGPVGAAGVGPYVSMLIHWESLPECRALAILIGLVVNPVAPAAVDLWTNFVLARLGHPLARSNRGTR